MMSSLGIPADGSIAPLPLLALLALLPAAILLARFVGPPHDGVKMAASQQPSSSDCGAGCLAAPGRGPLEEDCRDSDGASSDSGAESEAPQPIITPLPAIDVLQLLAQARALKRQQQQQQQGDCQQQQPAAATSGLDGYQRVTHSCAFSCRVLQVRRRRCGSNRGGHLSIRARSCRPPTCQ